MPLKAFVKLQIHDKKGRLISEIEVPAHSFTLQFLQILSANVYPSTSRTVKDNAGASTTVPDAILNGKVEFLASDDWGILVGTGTTPATTTDFAMETVIAEGVGAGQLSRSLNSEVVPGEVGANTDWKMIRTFTNSSGGTINVTEIGIIMYGDAGGTDKYLTFHEIVTSTPVPDGQALTVTITIRTTV